MLAPLVIIGGALVLMMVVGGEVSKQVHNATDLADIGGGFQLRQEAASAFLMMRSAALSDGVQLIVNSAWRSFAAQSRLYAEYIAGARTAVVAKPGTSKHESGDAVDIETQAGTNAAYQWLKQNANSYGFFSTVKSEPWHWEYRRV